MSSVLDVKRALETQLLAYVTAYPISVAWESIDFVPAEGEAFLDPTFKPTRPRQRELVGSATRDRFEGFYQINIVQKKGLGTNTIDQHYEQLTSYFNRGIGLTYVNADSDTVLVEINKFYIGDLNEDSPPWAFKPVYVEWRSDIQVG